MASYGAINFHMSDVYGGVMGTTEETIPEARDQQALVDDQKAATSVSNSGQKKFPIFGAILALVCFAVLLGVVK